jgi:hypothetical protein
MDDIGSQIYQRKTQLITTGSGDEKLDNLLDMWNLVQRAPITIDAPEHHDEHRRSKNDVFERSLNAQENRRVKYLDDPYVKHGVKFQTEPRIANSFESRDEGRFGEENNLKIQEIESQKSDDVETMHTGSNETQWSKERSNFTPEIYKDD